MSWKISGRLLVLVDIDVISPEGENVGLGEIESAILLNEALSPPGALTSIL